MPMLVQALPQQEAICRIKQELSSQIGERVKLSMIKSRGALWEREGVLEEIYPNLFIIEIEEATTLRKNSYSYADVFTKNIKITCCESGEDLFPWLPDRF
jgi:uncharacterized protein Veg